MVLRDCDIVDCRQPAERHKGNCMICGSHFCSDHAEPPNHTCPREEDDPDAFFDAYDTARAKHQEDLILRINLPALRKTASGLRGGLQCSLPALEDQSTIVKVLTSQMGGQNLHADVCFEDGVTWIARIRLDDPLIAPSLTRDLIVTSEVATLTFLAKTKVPTPKVYYYTLSSSLDDVGVPYMLMDKLKGLPLNWQSLEAPKKSRVLSQLADVFIELKKYPFEKSGSLILDNTQGVVPVVAGFAQVQLFKHPSNSLGPFTSTNDAARDVLDFYLDMYRSGELADFPVDTYLAMVYRKSLINKIYPVNNTTTQSSFFLKHFDDKGDHILIDEEANITGIIDWEYASAECEELAFSSPCMMWPVADYFDGKNELSSEEEEFAHLFRQKGHQRLADAVSHGRLHQRFWFFLGGGAPYDRAEFVSLFDGLRKAFVEQHGNEKEKGDNITTIVEPYEQWRDTVLSALTNSDPGIQVLLRHERAMACQEE